jgi:ribosomal protein L37AE/L43A
MGTWVSAGPVAGRLGEARAMRSMWTCPRCGRGFASRNQTHTCAALGGLDQHFANSAPQVRAAFDAVLAAGQAG